MARHKKVEKQEENTLEGWSRIIRESPRIVVPKRRDVTELHAEIVARKPRTFAEACYLAGARAALEALSENTTLPEGIGEDVKRAG